MSTRRVTDSYVNKTELLLDDSANLLTAEERETLAEWPTIRNPRCNRLTKVGFNYEIVQK